jgi:cytochrome P450
VFQAFESTFLMMNPPSHTRLRGLMTKAFNARQVESMRAVACTAAHELIDAFETQRTADLTTQYSFLLPAGIIGRMLDVPVDDARKLGAAAAVFVKVLDPAPLNADDVDHATAAYEEMERYFNRVVDARRARPGNDLVSLLLTVEESGEKLSQEEIVANVILLFTAGHETTANMVCNALIALHRHPQQLALLRSDPSRMPKAVFECLRYDGSVQMALRSPTEDVELAGVAVPRGTTIFLSLGAASHDTAKFTHPERLDIDRNEGRPLTFGAGIHHCLGYRLALIELESALSVLLERLPDFKLPDLDRLAWNQRGNLRGVDSLVATW